MEKIRNSFINKSRALRRRTDLGRGTAVTKVRITKGLTCEIEEGPWRLLADMSPRSGGAGAGPSPGTYGRAALGACLAITYMTWAAYRDIPIDQLSVEIQGDYDVRGMYDFPGVSPAYSELRYIVHISSPASESEVIRLLDEADRHTTFLECFRQPQKVNREVVLEEEAKRH